MKKIPINEMTVRKSMEKLGECTIEGIQQDLGQHVPSKGKDTRRRSIQGLVVEVLVQKGEAVRTSNKAPYEYMLKARATSLGKEHHEGLTRGDITFNGDNIVQTVRGEIEKIQANCIMGALPDQDYILSELKKQVDNPILSRYDEKRIMQSARYVLKNM